MYIHMGRISLRQGEPWVGRQEENEPAKLSKERLQKFLQLVGESEAQPPWEGKKVKAHKVSQKNWWEGA